MASGVGTTLPHRSVASIRSSQAQGSTPHTPSRPISSAYGSPSAIRADDDIVVIELATRHIRVGFAGDSVPKAVLQCGPDDQRRVGDFRAWQGTRPNKAWSKEYELWDYDIRLLDLGLFQDKLERLLRDAFSRYLLIDSRPRRAGLVMDSSVPVPLLSAVLDTLFNKFQTPTASIMSSAVMSTVSAGVRSALIIDMGWKETVVTSIYEYREAKKTSSIRAARLIHDAVYKEIKGNIIANVTGDNGPGISFEECEDIMCRLMWCRPSAFRSSQRQSAQLETVEERDESELDHPEIAQPATADSTRIMLNSASPPSTIECKMDSFSDVCEQVLFESTPPVYYDDHELPIPQLVYQHLLHLPLDIRAVCMSRIIFTGGCSNILGLKERIIDEVNAIVEKRGWEPVTGKAFEDYRMNPKLHRGKRSPRTSDGLSPPNEPAESQDRPQSAANAIPEHDPIEAKVARQKRTPKQIQGEMRVLHSLGPWTGASLMCQLKVPATAIVDRDVWLQQGTNGALRPGDVDLKAQQRQSMTTGGYIRGTGGHHGNWTLGAWGYLS